MKADAQRRRVIHAMAAHAAMVGDFVVVREVITLGMAECDPMENDHVVAEWAADYNQFDYSVFPRHCVPRAPRPGGEYGDEDDCP